MRKIVTWSALGIAMVVLLFVAIRFSPLLSLIKGKGEKIVASGSLVSVEYTLFDETGSVIDSNKGKDPLTYVHGTGQILPGLEKGLSGMKPNEQRRVRLKPEDGYGDIDPKAFHEVPRASVPSDALKVNTVIVVTSPEGMTFPARVSQIKERTVILDFNHPLAGKTLNFEVKILDVRTQ